MSVVADSTLRRGTLLRRPRRGSKRQEPTTVAPHTSSGSPGTLGQVRRQTRVGLTSESLANSPLTKVGESSVDSEVAIATASEIATPSGTVSL
jgi:hypothetical protein